MEYVVKMVKTEELHDYIVLGFGLSMSFKVEANNEQEAMIKALTQNPDYSTMAAWVDTLEEIEAIEAMREARAEHERQKAAKAAAKKAEKKAWLAEHPEEAQASKDRAKKNRYLREIKEKEELIKSLQAEINYRKKWIDKH